jgi:hypothetical protein
MATILAYYGVNLHEFCISYGIGRLSPRTVGTKKLFVSEIFQSKDLNLTDFSAKVVLIGNIWRFPCAISYSLSFLLLPNTGP